MSNLQQILSGGMMGRPVQGYPGTQASLAQRGQQLAATGAQGALMPVETPEQIQARVLASNQQRYNPQWNGNQLTFSPATRNAYGVPMGSGPAQTFDLGGVDRNLVEGLLGFGGTKVSGGGFGLADVLATGGDPSKLMSIFGQGQNGMFADPSSGIGQLLAGLGWQGSPMGGTSGQGITPPAVGPAGPNPGLPPGMTNLQNPMATTINQNQPFQKANTAMDMLMKPAFPALPNPFKKAQ